LANNKTINAKTEDALDYITSDATIIVDPPRAGLHENVVKKLSQTSPPTIVYLSCNPVTQARDIAPLLGKYKIKHIQGYNFFPRTPHIENLVVLELN
jgi:23S rRNA (uracil1939-C5)-methyltransferase